jgi:hypothetical protein
VVVARQVRAKDIPGILADDNDEETELEGHNDDAVDAGQRRELAEDLADAADPDVVPSEVHRFHEVIRDGERQANVDGQGGGQPAGLQNGEAGGREESGQRPRLAWSGEGMTNLTVPTADASIWMSTLQEVQRQTSLPLWPIRGYKRLDRHAQILHRPDDVHADGAKGERRRRDNRQGDEEDTFADRNLAVERESKVVASADQER